MVKFKVGEVIVEPTVGICIVEGVRKMVVDGMEEDFYIFRSGNTRVMVPRRQIKKRGIRRPMSKEEVSKVFTLLRSPVSPTRGDQADEYLNYKEILKTGEPQKISRLLRDLYILDQTDELKGKEREIMDQARRFLCDEITYVRGLPKTKVLERINECLKSMHKKKVAKDKEKEKKAKKK